MITAFVLLGFFGFLFFANQYFHGQFSLAGFHNQSNPNDTPMHYYCQNSNGVWEISAFPCRRGTDATPGNNPTAPPTTSYWCKLPYTVNGQQTYRLSSTPCDDNDQNTDPRNQYGNLPGSVKGTTFMCRFFGYCPDSYALPEPTPPRQN